MEEMMRFSVHALLRLRQRFQLSFFELTTLLAQKKYLKLYAVRNHDHLLVYSAPDNAYLILIVSYQAQVIKTVLPVHLYRQQVDAKLKSGHFRAARMLQVPYVEVRATVLELKSRQLATHILKRFFLDEVQDLPPGRILQVPIVSRKIERLMKRAQRNKWNVEALHVERDGTVSTFRSKTAMTFAAS